MQSSSTSEAQLYKQSIKDYEPSNQKQSAAGIKDIRPELVALSKNDGTRDLLEASVVAEQRFRSDKLADSIRERRLQKFDTVIIGAGPHGAALVQEFTRVNPKRSVLVIDAASRPGGTFADVGPVFALNSTNREDTGAQANVGRGQAGGPKGDGNLNAIADILGIPDFSGLKWPLAGHLGYVTTMAMEYSSAQLLLNTRVVAIGPNRSAGGGVRLTVQMNVSGTSSAAYDRDIAAQEVILATGIGKPTFFLPAFENARKQLAAAASDTQPPPLMGFGEFVSRVNEDLRNNRNPMAPYANKRLLVVGGGDSGKVVIEWLSGLGPDSKSYGPAQIGEPKSIVWSGVDFVSCQDFLATARSRYSRISSPLNSALVSLSPLKVTNLDLSNDAKTVVVTGSTLKLKKDGSFGPANLSPEDRKTIDELVKQGKFFTTKGLTTGELRSKDQNNTDGNANLKIDPQPGTQFDFVIDATGFRTEALSLLQAGFNKGLIPDGTLLSDYFEPVSDRLGTDANELLRGKSVNIVSRFKLPSNPLESYPIYAVGPANEQIFSGGLISKEELAGVSANSVSLFANIIRTKKVPAAIAQFSPSRNEISLSLSRNSDLTDRPLVSLASSDSVSPELSLELSNTPKAKGSFVVFPDNDDLEVGLRKILSSLKLEGDVENFKIWIFLDQRQSPATAEKKTVTLRIEPGFQDDESRNTLIAAINNDGPFKDLLFKLFPSDSVASSGRNLEKTFADSSTKVILVDEWASGKAGETASAVNVASSSVKKLQKATGIDLGPSTAGAASQSKKIDATLLESARYKELGCFFFTEYSPGIYRPIRGPKGEALALRLSPSRDGVEGLFDFTQGNGFSIASLYTLQEAIAASSREFNRVFKPNLANSPREEVSFFVYSGQAAYYDTRLINAVGRTPFRDGDSFDPYLPQFLNESDTQEIVTLRPTDNPLVLSLSVDAQEFRLFCTNGT
jgi:hypothetical protein